MNYVLGAFQGWSAFLPFLRECNSVKSKVIFFKKQYHISFAVSVSGHKNPERRKFEEKYSCRNKEFRCTQYIMIVT